ncbi:TonB-dependent receptor plug domain-containing protein [Luteolibacter algae]|uniref:TonB-dependent receptor plug domain-containing protein n=1 Tax=Luteolibacter algae TaxID=454151 RepID=A0ABW5D3F8_9BACT
MKQTQQWNLGRSARLALVMGAAPALVLQANAQEPGTEREEEIEGLDPLVVRGEEERQLDAAGLVTAEDLVEINATDLDEVFQKTPAVDVNGGRAQAQQIFVNGLESNLSNVTIDGAV